MNDAIKTYLHDHLAGSHFAIHLLESLREQFEGEALAAFAADLVQEIREDQEVLEGIIDEVGTPALDVAGMAGWLGEKVSQFKLHRQEARGGVGTFETLEALSLGIRGKLALWKALALLSEVEPEVPKLDFASLMARAEDHFSRVEERRLSLVVPTFSE